MGSRSGAGDQRREVAQALGTGSNGDGARFRDASAEVVKASAVTNPAATNSHRPRSTFVTIQRGDAQQVGEEGCAATAESVEDKLRGGA